MVRPDRKVTIGGVVGSVVTICAWLVHEIWAFQIPPGVEGAFVVLLTFLVSYWVRNDDNQQNQSSYNGRLNSNSGVVADQDKESRT